MLKGKFFSWILDSFAESSFALASLILFCLVVVFTYLERLLYRKLSSFLSQKSRCWQLAWLEASHLPFVGFLWVGYVALISYWLTPFLQEPWVLDVVSASRVIGFFALFVWWIVRLIDRIERVLMGPRVGKPAMDTNTMKAVAHLLRTVALVVVGLVFMQILKIPISGVLAFGGFGGIIVGFAGKDLLSNFFGGLMIFLDRPFMIGDWIRSSDKEVEGSVEHIGWRLTRIRTADKKPLFVPNALFLNISVENATRVTHRRIKSSIGLSTTSLGKLQTIVQGIKKRVSEHSRIDKNQPIFLNLVNLVSGGVPALTIELICFTQEVQLDRFLLVQEEILFIIVDTVEKNEGSFAIPVSYSLLSTDSH